MKDEEKNGAGLIGIGALNEMGRRLLDVLGAVEQASKGDPSKADNFSQSRGFTIQTPRGRMAGRAGFSVRHLTPEQPDRAPTRRAPVPEPKIDVSDGQLIDVFDEPTEILVTVAPCAFALNELAVRIEGAMLHIDTIGGRRFRKTVPLPRDPGDAVPALRLSNGILEIRIPKPVHPVPPSTP